MVAAPAHRAATALVAAVVGLLLLAPAGVTAARWYTSGPLSEATIIAGRLDFDVKPDAQVQLLSPFPPEQRAFTTSASCPVPAGYAACRTLTAAELPHQVLLPGDALIATQTFTAAARGTNLTADVWVDTSRVSSELPPGTTVTTALARGGAAMPVPATIRGSDPEEHKTAEWTARVHVTTPRQWPSDYQMTAVTFEFFDIRVEQKR